MSEAVKSSEDENRMTVKSCCSNSSCCPPQRPLTRSEPKIGRNDPCPCGNGRKFKKCCGLKI